jgi:dihydroxyacetone kinase-like predicted kinase
MWEGFFLTEYINEGKFKEMLAYASTTLNMRQEEINILNVFPVADGDTGTNMCFTLTAGC